jgi:hypothetical protein
LDIRSMIMSGCPPRKRVCGTLHPNRDKPQAYPEHPEHGGDSIRGRRQKMNPEYEKTVERVYQMFRTCPGPNRKESAEGWSVKEILGHLVDSVSNNHQRIARYIPKGNFN